MVIFFLIRTENAWVVLGYVTQAEVLFGACVIPGAYTLLRTVALAITITMSMIHDITDRICI